MLRLNIGWALVLALVGCVPEPKTTVPKASKNVEPVIQELSVERLPSFSILAWNVESGGSDPLVIAQQLKELAAHDVVCLSEVDPRSFDLG